MPKTNTLASVDPELYKAILCELDRQRGKLELIASENFTPVPVLATTASILTNKYAEGYPERRYYGGCEFVDIVENLAIDRAKRLFQAEYANVQPHSGSQANMAAYFSLIEPGDTILGMSLSHGGHLTHGSPVSFSGKLFKAVSYGVDRETETIDLAQVRRLALEAKPKLIVAGASAYSRIIDFNGFAAIADEVGAALVVDMAHIAGLVAAGLHPSPVPVADVVTTTTHKTLRGPRGGLILAKADLAAKLESTTFPCLQGGPLMHVIAAKAVALKLALEPDFADYQRQVVRNAKRLAESLKTAGFRLVSGGTDNHMILIDIGCLGMSGKTAENVLDQAGITTNKNAIPFDPQPPKVTSGLRIGTPAVTTRGMGEQEMDEIAQYFSDALAQPDSDSHLAAIREKVALLCQRFPLYQDLPFFDQ